jgi:hypothetical protein
MENKIYPGLLHILQKYLSGCRLILWKLSESENVGQMLKRNFHDVQIIYGSVDENDDVEAEDVIKAFGESDIMVHGSGQHISFAPDATFYLNILDEEGAVGFLDDHGLEEGKFICAIPRLRYTPCNKFKKMNWDEEKIRQVEETSGSDIAAVLMSLFRDPISGHDIINEAFKKIHSIYAEGCTFIADLIT